MRPKTDIIYILILGLFSLYFQWTNSMVLFPLGIQYLYCYIFPCSPLQELYFTTNLYIIVSNFQLTLTEEDELFMDEIVEEVEARELLELLQREQIVAQILREKHLQAIRDKARRMSLGQGVRGEILRLSGARGEREG